MTKKELFAKAHQMTREIVAQYPEINYRAQFSICLKSLNEESKQIETKNEGEVINMILTKKTVEVNKIQRGVAIKIENNKMFGVINKTRFIWNYTEQEIPKVEGTTGAEGVKASQYARLFILKRLELDNVTLNIKTKERTVEYKHLEEKDGVWLNYFANGYIRGIVNGVPFAWEPNKYPNAVAVNVAGFNGSITQYIDTAKIKARLKAAGFKSMKALMESFNEQSA